MLYINEWYKELDRLYKRKEKAKRHCKRSLTLFQETNDIWWFNQSCVWIRCALRDEIIIKKTLEIMYRESRWSAL